MSGWAMADIEYRIDEAPLIDTHEHLWGEATYTDAGLDILQDLFDNYVLADPVVAGASEGGVRRPVSYTHLTLPTKRIV